MPICLTIFALNADSRYMPRIKVPLRILGQSAAAERESWFIARTATQIGISFFIC